MPALRRPLVALSAAILVAAGLAACASDTTATQGAGETGTPVATPCALTASDQWVKAAESGMTAAFGTITNPGTDDQVVVSASSPAAGMMEIHEVVDKDGAMVMQPKAGGLEIPAGASATLAPGQDHLMLMDLVAPIEAGDEVEITIDCKSGGSTTFTAVAKPFDGAAENYQPSSPGSMESMAPSPSES